jgi:hypothetical protein
MTPRRAKNRTPTMILKNMRSLKIGYKALARIAPRPSKIKNNDLVPLYA